MHGCAVSHRTHSHNSISQHSTVLYHTLRLPLTLPPLPSFPPHPESHLPSSQHSTQLSLSLSTKTMFYPTQQRPMQNPLLFPAAMSCPFPRPGYTGSRSTHPVPKQSSHRHGLVIPSVALPATHLRHHHHYLPPPPRSRRAREYSRGRALVGHTRVFGGGFVQGP